MRNPSAINYYFGSKAKLVADLTREVNGSNSALLQRHIALADEAESPSPEAWAGIGVDFVIDLLSSPRGCCLIRVWSDDDDRHPDRLERFLAGPHPLAREWRGSVSKVFTDLGPRVAIARNVVLIRMLQWITVRRARRLLDESPHLWTAGIADLRPFLLELSVNLLTGPTTLTDEYFDPAVGGL